jgi:hypothetical protein
MDAGPSLLPSPLNASSKSGAAASRAVNVANGNNFRNVAMIEVWSNGVSPGGRMTEPLGTHGETITAGTRTPKYPKSNPSGDAPPGDNAAGGTTWS